MAEPDAEDQSMSQPVPSTDVLEGIFYPTSSRPGYVPFGTQSLGRDRKEEEELVDQVLKRSRIQRVLGKRQKNVDNIPPLYKQYKAHMKAAKRIAKDLAKMGYHVQELSDSDSSGKDLDIDDRSVKFMKLPPKNNMNDN